jgi:hypothetical protein
VNSLLGKEHQRLLFFSNNITPRTIRPDGISRSKKPAVCLYASA